MDWLESYFQNNENLRGSKIAARAAHATHLQLAPGLQRALITGAPQHVRGAQGWQPLDRTLQPDGAGTFGAVGLEAHIAADGTVAFPAQRYAHRTRGVGVWNRGAYTELAAFGAGRAAGERLVRSAGAFEHTIVLTSRGVKEELTLHDLPANLGAGALVYETEIDSAHPLHGEAGSELAAGALRLPAGAARDGRGTPLGVQRYLVREGGREVLYTGVGIEDLVNAVFPVVIDPVVNLGGSSLDGLVWGQNATYATARATSFGFDTSSAFFDVGQALSGGTYFVYRGFLKFSLASIPLNSLLLNATLGLVCTADFSTVADFDVQVVKQDWSAQDPLAAGNREAAYDACLAGTQDVIWKATSAISTGVQYQSPPLDLSWLVPGATAYYSLRSSRDKNNTTSGAGAERIQLAAAEHATPAFRPVLVVDYYSAATAVGKLAMGEAAVGVYDTRIKLRARRRRTLLPTDARKG